MADYPLPPLPYGPLSLRFQNGSPSRPPPTSGGKFIAIGIDFGTTYCGVSWAFSDSQIPNGINEITEWPSDYHLDAGESQVPTKYDIATDKWGYLISSDMNPVRWFKLLLLKQDDKSYKKEILDSVHLKHARDILAANPPITPVEVVSRYLRKLWQHTCLQIQSRVGASVFDNFPLRVAITVPAIWPPYAQQAMRDAARLAGILDERDIGATTLDLVQEPEAAGLSTLVERQQIVSLEKGESFIVCDAGGGTVDIISYTVTSKEPLRLVECVEGAGKLAGAFKVDEGFENHLAFRMKLKIKSLTDTERNNFVTKDWEHGVKRAFTGAPEPQKFMLSPPARAMGKMQFLKHQDSSISRSDVVTFFSPSLTGIRALVSSQFQGVEKATGKQPKSILLVGGLGSSPYIYNMLQEQYPKKVLRPIRPWSAVARGAVIRLLQDKLSPQADLPQAQRLIIDRIPEVITRKSRYSYGVVYYHLTRELVDFDPSVDESNSHVYPDGNKYTLRIHWYLKKGDDLSKTTPVRHTYSTWARHRADDKCKLGISYCQSDKPPIRPTSSVLKLCQIECKWDKHFEEWKAFGDQGWRFFDGISLGMRCEGQLRWTMQIGPNEEEKEISVDYSP